MFDNLSLSSTAWGKICNVHATTNLSTVCTTNALVAVTHGPICVLQHTTEIEPCTLRINEYDYHVPELVAAIDATVESQYWASVLHSATPVEAPSPALDDMVPDAAATGTRVGTDCSICMERPVDTLRDCCHLCACRTCAMKVSRCPICRAPWRGPPRKVVVA